MICKHWKNVPKIFGDSPICGFDKTGKFNQKNWSCKLLLDLRELLGEKDDKGIWCNDQNLYIGTLGDNFFYKNNNYTHILISVYKSRGNTEGVWVLNGNKMVKANEQMVIKAVNYLKQVRK
jgi:hypothetical protein